jgi:hypothetical protein
MSIFNWISGLFEPASKLIDDLHYSGEEKAAAKAKQAELKNILAQIEAQVATKTLDFQSKLIEANSKIAVAEQKHGNFLSKSWRPLCSIACMLMLSLMGFGIIEFNQFLAGVYAGFLGIYVPARSWEKKK